MAEETSTPKPTPVIKKNIPAEAVSSASTVSKKPVSNVNITPMQFNILITTGAIIILLIAGFILWNFRIVGFCGDGRCDQGECANGCTIDCTPNECINSNCEPAIGETCSNSSDCGCESGQICQPDREGKEANGCYIVKLGDSFCDYPLETKGTACGDCGCNPGFYCEYNQCEPKCGDNICAQGEKPTTCCSDCGCDAGFECINNLCERTGPALTVEISPLDEGSSVAKLYARSTLEPLARINITNGGKEEAKNLTITLEFGEYATETRTISSLPAGEIHSIFWEPAYSERFLDIETEREVTLKVDVDFADSMGQQGRISESENIPVKGRNTMEWSGKYESAYVTPLADGIQQFASEATQGIATYTSDAAKDAAARRIFQELSAYGISYITDPNGEDNLDYTQLPEETLKRRGGDCDDLAILYASLLEAVGIETRLILYSDHLALGYIVSSNNIVPIESTMIENVNSYETAKETAGKKYTADKKNLISPRAQWAEGVKQLSLANPPTLNLPNISQPLVTLDCPIPEFVGSVCEQTGVTPLCSVNSRLSAEYNGVGSPIATVVFSIYDTANNVLDSQTQSKAIIQGTTLFSKTLSDIGCKTDSCGANVTSLTGCTCDAKVQIINTGSTGYRCLVFEGEQKGCFMVPNGTVIKNYSVQNPTCQNLVVSAGYN